MGQYDISMSLYKICYSINKLFYIIIIIVYSIQCYTIKTMRALEVINKLLLRLKR